APDRFQAFLTNDLHMKVSRSRFNRECVGHGVPLTTDFNQAVAEPATSEQRRDEASGRGNPSAVSTKVSLHDFDSRCNYCRRLPGDCSAHDEAPAQPDPAAPGLLHTGSPRRQPQHPKGGWKSRSALPATGIVDRRRTRGIVNPLVIKKRF